MASPIPERKQVLQRELDINRQTQTTLKNRINQLQQKHPENEELLSVFFSQSFKDQVELDELKAREIELIELIDEEDEV
ncbi:MAG: hypothetical protein PVI40_08785 [Chlamydiota bacterium]|jgi:hypothetical protein